MHSFFFFFFSPVNDLVAGNCRCTGLGWMSAELDVKKGEMFLKLSPYWSGSQNGWLGQFHLFERISVTPYPTWGSTRERCQKFVQFLS